MALLSWSNQYLLGNEPIDSQHEELFRLINAFHDHWLASPNHYLFRNFLARPQSAAEAPAA